MTRTIVTVVAVLAWLGSAAAATAPCGSEFQVDGYTTSSQNGARVAALADGGFVVVWTSYGSDGTDDDGTSVHARRFDALGLPFGDESQVNTYTTGHQGAQHVVSLPDGGFLVSFDSQGSFGSDTDERSVQLRRYDASGVPVGAEFQVNTYTTGHQGGGDVGVDAAGGFVVVWSSFGGFGSDPDSSIQARRFDATGQALGSEFQVNTYTTSYQYGASIALEPSGEFVVAWTSYGSLGSDTVQSSVQVRRFDAAGQPLDVEFQVNDVTSGYQDYAQVSRDGTGGFVVVWSGDGIRAKRFDASGTASAAEFQVSEGSAFARGVGIAPTGDGGFLVVWEANSTPGDSFWGIQARPYDATGMPEAAPFQLNTHVEDAQYFPDVASDGQGNFLVTWYSQGSVGTDPDASIAARRVAAGTCVLPTTTSTSTSTTTTLPTDLLRARRLLMREVRHAHLPVAQIVSTDPDTGVGRGEGSPDDPTLAGGRMRIVSVPGAFDLDVALPAAGWQRTKRGYRYDDAEGAKVRLRDGHGFRVTLRPAALVLGATDPTPVIGVLRLGERRLCTEFPAGSVRLKPGKLTARASVRPSACAEPDPAD